MKIAVVENQKNVIKEVEDIKLDGRKGAIVQVYGCGLCGSDIVKLKTGVAKDGTVLGHEIVGKIVEINTNTDFKNGDRIVSSHHIPCFECDFCKNGHYSMCKHFKSTNIYPGGFSEYIYLSEEHLKNVAYPLPDDMTFEEISFYEPLGCIVRAVKRTELNKDATVLVIGLGSIGFLSGQAFNAIYNCKTYGCDLIQDRIDLANKVGIEAFNSKDFSEAEKYIKDKTLIEILKRVKMSLEQKELYETKLYVMLELGNFKDTTPYTCKNTIYESYDYYCKICTNYNCSQNKNNENSY